ncbi:MAG: N-acetylmuramoyl-L-alanine amidase [Gemmatimonadetes bacterium]|nr:N-acetylmuramoyl-L-alanine amidase [Gemmatimonadota bacterium]
MEPPCTTEAASTALVPAPLTTPAALPASPFDDEFRAAGAEFGVPAAMLKALGWVETRWRMVEGEDGHGGLPAAYGVMALRGERLERGARLAAVSVAAARRDPAANIRAAAALLADEARGLDVDGAGLERWAPAVARFSGIELPAGRDDYVGRAYAVLRDGVARAAGSPSLRLVAVPASSSSADPCPEPSPPVETDYPGAIWRASPNFNERPAGETGVVHMVIIHTCEGAYSGCWSWLANEQSGVSSHYVVEEDGREITQLVRERARAWHIAARYDCSLNHGHECWLNDVQSNHFTIGIEHAGFASQPSFPADQIDVSASLVCDISREHAIPRDPQHIVAHGQLQPHNRTDPGPNWPWTEYIGAIQRHCGEIVVDDSDAENVAARAAVEAPADWTHTRATPGYYGRGYRWASTSESADDPVVFRFRVESAGEHLVEARWTAGDNRTARARYAVVRADGTVAGEVEMDQREGGGAWHELGRWDLPAGWNEVRLSRRGDAGAVVVADAIRAR